jgi:hypothetical protein
VNSSTSRLTTLKSPLWKHTQRPLSFFWN